MNISTLVVHLRTFVRSYDGGAGTVPILEAFVHLCFKGGAGVTQRGVFLEVLDRACSQVDTEGRYLCVNDDLDIVSRDTPQSAARERDNHARAWELIQGIR